MQSRAGTFDDISSEMTDTSRPDASEVTIDDSGILRVDDLTKFFETAFLA